jgi:hypothetical protein
MQINYIVLWSVFYTMPTSFLDDQQWDRPLLCFAYYILVCYTHKVSFRDLPLNKESDCDWIESGDTDGRRGAVLQHGDWSRGYEMHMVKEQVVT